VVAPDKSVLHKPTAHSSLESNHGLGPVVVQSGQSTEIGIGNILGIVREDGTVGVSCKTGPQARHH
jgi:hypothetical protein